MKPQSFAIKATVEKPFSTESRGDDINFTLHTDDGEALTFQMDESEHAGLEVEWFPLQDRFASTGLRAGVYCGGSYSEPFAFLDTSGGLSMGGRVRRFDAQYGIKLAIDLPVGQGGVAPYARAGIHQTLYYPVEVFSDKVLNEGDVFNPEVGVDAALGKIGKADILVNAHGQWLDFGTDGTQQLLIGGGVGIGF